MTACSPSDQIVDPVQRELRPAALCTLAKVSATAIDLLLTVKAGISDNGQRVGLELVSRPRADACRTPSIVLLEAVGIGCFGTEQVALAVHLVLGKRDVLVVKVHTQLGGDLSQIFIGCPLQRRHHVTIQ